MHFLNPLHPNISMHILHTVLHFPRCWQGEFVHQSKASLVGDHFLYSCGLNVWFRGDIVRRNETRITPTGQSVTTVESEVTGTDILAEVDIQQFVGVTCRSLVIPFIFMIWIISSLTKEIHRNVNQLPSLNRKWVPEASGRIFPHDLESIKSPHFRNRRWIGELNELREGEQRGRPRQQSQKTQRTRRSIHYKSETLLKCNLADSK